MFSYLNYCKELINAGMTKVTIYVFSSKPEIHDNITRVKGSFKQTMKGINNLKNMNNLNLDRIKLKFTEDNNLLIMPM